MSSLAQHTRFLKQNWALVGVLAVALCVTGWFAFQFISTFLFLNDPRNHDSDLKAWMNPHFVMELYDLPRPLVLELLERPDDETGGIKLGQVANELRITMEELTERIRAGAATYRERS